MKFTDEFWLPVLYGKKFLEIEMKCLLTCFAVELNFLNQIFFSLNANPPIYSMLNT